MMKIHSGTKISVLIKENPAVIEAIAGINNHFQKLKNPVLRKILAPRITIAEAARIGKCDVSLFFETLMPLGFILDSEKSGLRVGLTSPEKNAVPPNTQQARYDVLLDVREDLASGHDPFKKIMDQINRLDPGKILLLVNSFEPIPLVRILGNQGHTVSMETIHEELVHTYIQKAAQKPASREKSPLSAIPFETIEQRFEGKMRSINVRELPMPQPMITILSEMDTMPDDMALFVYHKKIPLFLLPELKTRNIAYTHRTTEEGVEMILYKMNPAT